MSDFRHGTIEERVAALELRAYSLNQKEVEQDGETPWIEISIGDKRKRIKETGEQPEWFSFVTQRWHTSDNPFEDWVVGFRAALKLKETQAHLKELHDKPVERRVVDLLMTAKSKWLRTKFRLTWNTGQKPILEWISNDIWVPVDSKGLYLAEQVSAVVEAAYFAGYRYALYERGLGVK